MEILRNYAPQIQLFNDYLETFSSQAENSDREYIYIVDECSVKYYEMINKSRKDFCAANQHIVPLLVTELAAANPSIPDSFFLKASNLPLVAENFATTPAWEFTGFEISYDPGNFALDTYGDGTSLKSAKDRENQCWLDHYAKESVLHNDMVRMYNSYNPPIKHFSIYSGRILSPW